MPGRNLKLLCLDGGGVRGLSSLYILQRLMEEINPAAPPKPCEYFDIIGGTSTGGLIAIMLGRLEMHVNGCIEAYIRLCETIFADKRTFGISMTGTVKARFKANPLEAAIKKVIVDQGLAEDELLQSPNSRCKVFVCATSGNLSTPVLFRSYRSARGTSSLYDHTKIWEAARATSAAPTFFDPIRIGKTDRTFGDGATGTNNPVEELWNEAIDLCHGEVLGENLACLVSIGTGVPVFKKFGSNIKQVVQAIARIATETENTANSFIRAHPELTSGEQRYFRFNTPGGLGEIGIDEASEAGTIEDMTDIYLRQQDTFKMVQKCVVAITGSEQVSAFAVSAASASVEMKMVRRRQWSVVLSEHKTSGVEFLEKLSDYNHYREYSRRSRQKLEQTTKWILDEPQFQSWLRQKSPPCAWLTGIIGCGKSVTTTTVIDTTFENAKKSGTPVLYYFFNHSFRNHLTARALLESYTKQLLLYFEMVGKEYPSGFIEYLVQFYGPKNHNPSADEVLDELLLPLLTRLEHVVIILDGLDECDSQEVSLILRLFRKLLGSSPICLFISCREEVNIERRIQGSVRIRITPENTKNDMALFIKKKLHHMQRDRRLSDNEDVVDYVEKELIKKADRMFLWAKLQIEFLWDKCIGENAVDDEIYRTLGQLPDNLNKTYTNYMRKINQDKSRQALASRALTLICAAAEPFQIRQLQEALAIDPDSGELRTSLMVQRDELLACCGSLCYISMEEDTEHILLAHNSVRQFLRDNLEENGANIELRLGLLCIAHLHKHIPQYDLSISGQGFAVGRQRLTVPTPRSIMSAATGIEIPRFFLSRQVRTSPVTVPVLSRKASPAFDVPGFLQYSKRNWTSLTYDITDSSQTYVKYKTVALTNDEYWWIFPWRRCYHSYHTHVHAIYSWAILNCHHALLRLAIDEQLGVQNVIYRLPLISPIGARMLLPFQAAAEFGDVKTMEILLQILPRSELEAQDPSALYIADLVNNEPVKQMLLSTYDFLPKGFVLENGHSFVEHSSAFSRNGKMVAIISRPDFVSPEIIIWDLESKSVLMTIPSKVYRIIRLAFSPNGSKVAAISINDAVRVWDTVKGELMYTLEANLSPQQYTVAFLSENEVMTTGAHSIRVWDLATNTLSRELQKLLTNPFESCNLQAVSSNGSRLAICHSDIGFILDVKISKITVVDTTSGKHLSKFEIFKDDVKFMVLSQNGKMLALVISSTASDRLVELWNTHRVELWDTVLGKRLHTLSHDSRSANDAVFSSDGATLAIASERRRSIQLWETSSGILLTAFQDQDSLSKGPTDVLFSPDGMTLMVGFSDSGIIKFWNVRPWLSSALDR